MIVTRVALLLSAFLFCFPALAQSSPAPSAGGVSYPISTVRNVATIGAYRVAPDNVARHAFAHAIGGLVQADAQTVIPMPDGRNLPVTVRSQIPKATAAAAIGRFALKSIPILSAGVALYDLGEEMGFGLDNSSGTLQVTTQVIDIGCSQYGQRPNFTACGGGTPTPALPSWVVRVEGMYRQCYAQDYCVNASGQTVLAYDSYGGVASAQTTTNQPSSPQAFQDALLNRASFPSDSAYSRALRDAINSGEFVPLHPAEVTGPASTPGPVTTTTDSVNNTTTTSTTTHHHTYDGPNVTTTTTTTNVTVDNTTSNVISSTTTTTQPVLPEASSEDAPDVSFSDTALPPIPKLYEPEYPEGLVGVWNAKKAELEATTLVNLVSELMPNVGASGTCPSWVLSMNLAVWDFGSHDVSPPCWLWDFARAVIIACSLLLARRLIFGG